MKKYIDIIRKNYIKEQNDKKPITTGIVTADNEDGTYNVKINESEKSFHDVPTNSYGMSLAVGDGVLIGYEDNQKESPRIMGDSKNIAQTPKTEIVNFSGSGGGLRTITVDITPSVIIPSGFMAAVDADYNTVHNSIDGSDLIYPEGEAFEIFNDYILVGQIYSKFGPYEPHPTYHYYHHIFRGILILDTSIIPINAIITNAILKLWMGRMTSTNFDVIIQNGQPNYPNNPMINSDFNYLNYHNNGGSINTVDITDGIYNDITLNINGRAWINKGGYTKLILRSSKDIASIPAGSGTSYVAQSIYAAYDDPISPPKLTIIYTI